MNKNILLICQGSQSIQLIRELFSIGFKPNQIQVITLNENKNLSFQMFLEFYQIQKKYASYKSINDVLLSQFKNTFDLTISFSNPFIIPENIINKSKFINFHPGWLPAYRGSLSTVQSLINIEKFVGGSWHYLTKDVDKGNIISRFRILINENDTAFSLNHKIFSKGILLLRKVLLNVENGYVGIKQNPKKGKFYYNKFPSLEKISDKKLLHKINYFPPNFK
tara:strand:- start:3981 stop:4646 length:666 start_codon:yes stop_codon:yes gene_type:complete